MWNEKPITKEQFHYHRQVSDAKDDDKIINAAKTHSTHVWFVADGTWARFYQQWQKCPVKKHHMLSCSCPSQSDWNDSTEKQTVLMNSELVAFLIAYLDARGTELHDVPYCCYFHPRLRPFFFLKNIIVFLENNTRMSLLLGTPNLNRIIFSAEKWVQKSNIRRSKTNARCFWGLECLSEVPIIQNNLRVIYGNLLIIFIYTHIYTIPTGPIVIYEYLHKFWILQFS